jgi:CarD family transcriptional regulator
VAGKVRQKTKKGSSVSAGAKKSAAVRRTSQTSRGNARGAPAAKAPVAKKAPVEGAMPVMQAKKTTQRQGFKVNEFIVYPAHGVGQILAIEEQEVAGAKLELFVINFIKDKMTLRVPTAKIVSVGMRKLSEGPVVKRALETLKGRARIKRTMWSRRAQEYEAKINSGDLVSIAEVVRDLFRSENQPEQSYSERQLYEAALDRMAREIAAVQDVDEVMALQAITEALTKGVRVRKPDLEEEERVEAA